MCKYCKLVEDNATGEKHNDNALIGRIKDGSQIYETYLDRYIVESTYTHISELVIGHFVKIDDSVYPIKEKHIKIKYCPFCGEEL